MLGNRLENVRKNKPLIHNITNYVTVNDCANILLACGASPIMSDDLGEVEEITSICSGLNINMGTLNQHTIPSMFLAGKKANELNHPIILDPVGVGASKLRTKTALQLLKELRFTVIRGNISEIKALALGTGTTKGVDAHVTDIVNEKNLEETVNFAKKFAERTGAIIGITGAIDIVTNTEEAYIIRNGHPIMSKITGTGCMLTAMIAAYVAANPDNILEATAGAICAMGICGEQAYDRLAKEEGNSSCKNYIIDQVYNLTGEQLEGGARYEMG